MFVALATFFFLLYRLFKRKRRIRNELIEFRKKLERERVAIGSGASRDGISKTIDRLEDEVREEIDKIDDL